VIRNGLATAIGLPLLGQSSLHKGELQPSGNWQGFRPGVASYTFRKLDTDATIRAMQRLGLAYISLKDFHLPLNSSPAEISRIVAKFKDAGITPISCGNITMQNDPGNIRQAFEYAKAAGIPVIVCSPHPASMPILDKMVKEYNIKLAIHNHGPEDKNFPSPAEVWQAIKEYDNRIGLCIDVGHTARAKADPAKAILNYRQRLYDLHFKDITTTEPEGKTIAAGRGVLNLRAIVVALMKIKYNYLFSIEYESSPEDPLPEVAETLGYAKGLIRGLT